MALSDIAVSTDVASGVEQMVYLALRADLDGDKTIKDLVKYPNGSVITSIGLKASKKAVRIYGTAGSISINGSLVQTRFANYASHSFKMLVMQATPEAKEFIIECMNKNIFIVFQDRKNHSASGDFFQIAGLENGLRLIGNEFDSDNADNASFFYLTFASQDILPESTIFPSIIAVDDTDAVITDPIEARKAVEKMLNITTS